MQACAFSTSRSASHQAPIASACLRSSSGTVIGKERLHRDFGVSVETSPTLGFGPSRSNIDGHQAGVDISKSSCWNWAFANHLGCVDSASQGSLEHANAGLVGNAYHAQKAPTLSMNHLRNKLLLWLRPI